MYEHKCTRLIEVIGSDKRIRCNNVFTSNKEKIILSYCPQCRNVMNDHSVRKNISEQKKVLREKKNAEKGWLFDKPLFSGEQIDKGWEFILGILVIVIIGIAIALSQESNNYRNESLPGRYGYSISKVLNHI